MAGRLSKSRPEPSERNTAERTPPSTSLALRTTAPAPSPKRTQMLRSRQSMMRLMVSAPMTRAVSMLPLLTDWAAMFIA